MLAVLVGCAPPNFHAEGSLRGFGDPLGDWRWRPQGCVRAAPGSSGTLSLLWIDPVRRDASRANQAQYTAPDAPLRLDLGRTSDDPGAEVYATLHTVRIPAVRLDRATCGTLALHTREQPPAFPGARPSLAGTLALDCRTGASRFTADLTFSRCEF